MRHRNHSQRIARKPNQARLLLRNLTTSIILYERVKTTKKRAQVVRGIVDKVICMGKKFDRVDLAIRRMQPFLSDDNASRKVLEVLKQRYATRSSGFTSIKPLGQRGGDGALLCEISLIDAAAPELVDASADTEKTKKTSKKPSSKKSS